MSQAANQAAKDWLQQLAEMRATIAALKLPQTTNGDSESVAYGADLDLDDDDLSPISGDDFWDLIRSQPISKSIMALPRSNLSTDL